MGMPREERVRALERLAERWSERPEIETARGESRIVSGVGNPCASLMLVGEAPGAQEDRAGRPFVGPAGKILDDALESAGIEREDLWITNSVKFRPTMPGVGARLKNRAPTAAEMSLFRSWLQEELAIIRPGALVCLGATAARAVLGHPVKMMSERGHWFTGPDQLAVIPTYHPAFLLRRTSDFDERFAELVADLKAAAARAAEGTS